MNKSRELDKFHRCGKNNVEEIIRNKISGESGISRRDVYKRNRKYISFRLNLKCFLDSQLILLRCVRDILSKNIEIG